MLDNNTNETQQNETMLIKINEQTLFATLAYLGALLLLPYFLKKEDPFVQYHVKQGLVLFLLEIVIYISSSITPFLGPLWGLCYFVTFVFICIGIYNALTNQEKNLPYIGHYAKRVSL